LSLSLSLFFNSFSVNSNPPAFHDLEARAESESEFR
jgi:hypothetical protein